jgi:acetyltransferase-like isoleucine patch superfamily enzyme
MHSSDAAPSAFQKVLTALKVELYGLHPRLHALTMAAALLPRRNAARARARLFALAGFRIGDGTRLHSSPRISGSEDLFSRLVIGKDCSIDEDCAFDLEESITIGDRVSIGPGAMILTSTHELGPRDHRAGPIMKSPVKVEDGALLGARSIILPGVTIGAGAVVNPGAVVNKDVSPHTRVGGAPAVQLEVLNNDEPVAT